MMMPGTIPCDFCDAMILPEDFQNGKAVILLKKNYCETCMAAAVKRSKQKHAAPSPAFQTPPPRPPALPDQGRRRHERKECSVPVELSVYLESGQLYDRGNAVLWNVSLSGALLRALVLPEKALPLEPHQIGIRLLEGVLKDFHILGRPVRLVHSEDGIHLAIEFVKTEEAEIKQLRKLL
jgi:hypothetical protein